MPRRKVRNICPSPVRKCPDCAFFSSVCPFRERTSAGDGCLAKERAKEKPLFVNRPSRRALPARRDASYARKPRSRSQSHRARRSSAVVRWRRYVPKARPSRCAVKADSDCQGVGVPIPQNRLPRERNALHATRNTSPPVATEDATRCKQRVTRLRR
jgi:hypothetical protein